MIARSTLAVALAISLLTVTARVTPVCGQSPTPDVVPAAAAADIMPIDQVRIGMKGYGLTVFHGTEIEPFPVEVVSVISDSSPGRGTIWIRSHDPRLVHSGPVQGMSGSPIYLWEEGQEQEVGQGGRLIGAFAFGYAMIKECLAGVQPIELMQHVGRRASEHDPDAGGPSPQASLLRAHQTMQTLSRLADQRGVSPINGYRLNLMSGLIDQLAASRGLAHRTDSAKTGESGSMSPLPPAPTDAPRQGQVMRMMLPMAVGSPDLASLTAPLLEPMGLVPFADAGGTISGPPPAGIDADAVRLAPGSVLSIPLAYGDMDLSAVGTVTDVLPDGTVIGFGHPMFGQGRSALPMATGYVHFVVPRLTTSFKQSGSLRIQGTIVQDASAAVAGIGERLFDVAPVHVDVQMLDLPAERYSYEVVHHPELTPLLSMIVALQSITAEQALPVENTLYVDGDIVLSGDRHLPINIMLAGSQGTELLFDVLPPLMALMNNSHQNLKLESMNLSARVEPVLRVGALTHARLDAAQVAPGETIRVAATVQPYGQSPEIIRAKLDVPGWLPEGDYPLILCDAATYANLMMSNRPHLMATESIDDLTDVVRRILSIRRDALYLVLQLPDQGIAVGRSEMPRLPSSRKAMIATPTSTLAVPFVESAETIVPTDVVVQGQMPFTVAVRHKQPPPDNTRRR